MWLILIILKLYYDIYYINFIIYNILNLLLGSQLGERTEKLEYTVKKLMDVAKELKESKKTADEVNATRLKKLGKRYLLITVTSYLFK